MNKERLRSILSTEHNADQWRDVLREVFGVAGGLRQNPKPISVTNDKLAEKAFELGSFETSDDRLVGLYRVDLKGNVRIGQNRVGVRSLLRNIYKYDVDAALVVFVQNDKWRLSMISEIRILDDDGHPTEQKTEPKRFTYLLGEGETVRTAVERLDLFHESDATLKSLTDAFSVEKLNRDFFREYKEVFHGVETDVLKTIHDDELSRLFTQRLLNRLIFIYFIQKKGWMTFEGDTNYLRRIFDRAIANGDNFYSDRLYWVFFYGLSNQAESRAIQTNETLKDRRGDVPYLNGGLFEMENDGFDEKGAVAISDDCFRATLELFERYNFTIDESTPFDVEIAVDPEMLGKVFEELVTDRHGHGSYYTPRQVVSFMCRESLKHYLSPFDTPDAIHKLVDEGNGASVKNPEKILGALKNLRVCDPACGSGAYLLGMMQELLHVREALFASKTIAHDAQYNWKREIIENSIYGVDKDRFAVQIACLRLWLSLAIESDEPKPLPNLKYKIGCGDSLLAPLETDLQPDLHRRALIEQFRARKEEYAEADEHHEKSGIDIEIERLRVELARLLHHLPEPPSPAKLLLAENEVEPLRAKVAEMVRRGEKDLAETYQKRLNNLLAEITKWKDELTVDHYETPEYFDWAVEFAEVFEDGGFDVVIGNPPYVDSETMTLLHGAVRQKYNDIYQSAKGNWDLFVIFVERGIQLSKTGGSISFIVPNKLIGATYTIALREIFREYSIHEIRDYSEVTVFTHAAVYPVVFRLSKDKNRRRVRMSVMGSLDNPKITNEIAPEIFYADVLWDRYFVNSDVLELAVKLASNERLGSYFNGILGAATVGEAYAFREVVDEFDNWNGETYKKLINTGTIDPYTSSWSVSPTQYIKGRFDAPIVYDDHIVNISPRRYEQSCSPKLIIGGMNKSLECFFDSGEYLAGKSTTIILDGGRLDLKFVCGLINSRLVSFWYRTYYKSLTLAGGYLRINNNEIKTIPIPKCSEQQRADVVKLVEVAVTERRNNTFADITDLDEEINQLIYRLYKLTDDEIAIIEGNAA